MKANQIENQLRSKADDELVEIVDNFFSALEELSKKYNNSYANDSFNLKITTGSNSFDTKNHEIKYVKNHQLRSAIITALRENHLSRMTEVKVVQLLKKVDLIS